MKENYSPCEGFEEMRDLSSRLNYNLFVTFVHNFTWNSYWPSQSHAYISSFVNNAWNRQGATI